MVHMNRCLVLKVIDDDDHTNGQFINVDHDTVSFYLNILTPTKLFKWCSKVKHGMNGTALKIISRTVNTYI